MKADLEHFLWVTYPLKSIPLGDKVPYQDINMWQSAAHIKCGGRW